MAGVVGQAFVQVVPVTSGFRQGVEQGVARSIGQLAVDVPIQPLASAAAIDWKRIAGGAVIPVPVQPVLAPAGLAGATRSSKQLGESFLATSSGASALRASMLGVGAATGATIIGFTALGAGLFTFLSASKAAVTSAADLEQTLNVLQVTAGASASEMERVAAEAKALGADLSLPATSANDAAVAMTELAKAGLSIDQAIAGARGVLQLASAANLGVAESAELAASALNAFQLEGSEAVRVADLLAGAAIAAQGSMGDFGLALSQSAAVAHQAGLSISDTTVLLTELAKAGIQGSDAGTSLRVALLRLIAPTKEAQGVLRELGIQVTDASGAVRTDVFEQLRISLARLEPATRNATLALLFGADAVRSASIFVREGAEGFRTFESQVTQSGLAADLTAAKAKGFSGSVAGLSSNLETLGTTIGSAVLPFLTNLAQDIAAVIGVANRAADEIGELADALDDLPGANRVASLFKALANPVGLARLSPLGAGVKFIVDQFRDGEQAAEAFQLRFKGLPAQISTIGDELAALGAVAGGKFTRGIGNGILSEEQQAVLDARTALTAVRREGDRMVADAIRAGELAVQAAAFSAKQNLIQIGGELSGLAAQFIDTGPLSDRIKQLQASLDVSQAGQQRAQLRRGLRDAQQELAQAEAQVALRPGQRLSAQQRAGVEQFLTPFREKVKDAQAALQEFSTEGVIAKLQRQAEQQTQVVTRGIADLVARFNTGKITLNQLNRETIDLLRRNIPGFGQAGNDQGAAFRAQFLAQMRALKAQAAAIVVGPQTARTGFEPAITRPAAAAAQARQDVADARAAAAARNVQATKDVEKALTGKQGTNELLARILKELEGGPSQNDRPRPTPSPGPRTTRRGGR